LRFPADTHLSLGNSAGISGLTSALLLAKKKGNIVTVVAKHMPGDYDIEYTSPWAGANVMPWVASDLLSPNSTVHHADHNIRNRMAVEADSRWERGSWPEFKKLAAEVPEAGVHFLSLSSRSHELTTLGPRD
jgi:D-amino-acid oxidase